jgi:transposase
VPYKGEKPVLEELPGRNQSRFRAPVRCVVRAPARAVDRYLAGPGLLAHVLTAKFADPLPLYRQSQTYARERVCRSAAAVEDRAPVPLLGFPL